jgi:hypothetical protein
MVLSAYRPHCYPLVMTQTRETEEVFVKDLKKGDVLTNGIEIAEDARQISKMEYVIAHTRPRVKGIMHMTLNKNEFVRRFKD